MSFISFPMGKLYKKNWKKTLKNFPAGYVGKFYRNSADNVDTFLGVDFYSRIANETDLCWRMFKNIYCPLATFLKEFRMTLTTTWQEIELTMVASDNIRPYSQKYLKKTEPFRASFSRYFYIWCWKLNCWFSIRGVRCWKKEFSKWTH